MKVLLFSLSLFVISFILIFGTTYTVQAEDWLEVRYTSETGTITVYKAEALGDTIKRTELKQLTSSEIEKIAVKPSQKVRNATFFSVNPTCVWIGGNLYCY